MAALTISNLSKSFGTFEALSDVSLDVAAGEFICLLGGSGCGKTTLLRLIAGLETHDRGEMRLGGQDVTAVPSHQRGIGMVFQSLALFPHLDVAGNIGYGLTLRGEAKRVVDAEVARLLDMVSLDGLGARPVFALSGGQRQRVAIARALALKPGVFLMDEPFSALDAALRDQMQLEIKRIQRALGITTIFVTHDQREAMALADRVVVLNAGRIEQAGTPDALYMRPETRFVAAFIGDNNLLNVEVDGGAAQFAGAEVNVPDATPAGACTLCVRPEAIKLTTNGQGLQGTVTSLRRLGAIVERRVDVGGQTLLQSGFAGQSDDIEPGSKVSLTWDPVAAWVLPQ